MDAEINFHGRNGRLRENNVHLECEGAHKRSPCLDFLPIADNLWSSMISPLTDARRRRVKRVWTWCLNVKVNTARFSLCGTRPSLSPFHVLYNRVDASYTFIFPRDVIEKKEARTRVSRVINLPVVEYVYGMQLFSFVKSISLSCNRQFYHINPLFPS